MTAATAISAAYGLVLVALLVYVRRLRHRLRRLETEDQEQTPRSAGSAIAP